MSNTKKIEKKHFTQWSDLVNEFPDLKTFHRDGKLFILLPNYAYKSRLVLNEDETKILFLSFEIGLKDPETIEYYGE